MDKKPRERLVLILIVLSALSALASARYVHMLLAQEEMETLTATIVDIDDSHSLEKQIVHTVDEKDVVVPVRGQPDSTDEHCVEKTVRAWGVPSQANTRCTCSGPVVDYDAPDGRVVSRHCPRRKGRCPATGPKHLRLRDDGSVECQYGPVPRKSCRVNGTLCEYVAHQCPNIGEEIDFARNRKSGAISCVGEGQQWNKCTVQLEARRFSHVIKRTASIDSDVACASKFKKGASVSVHFSPSRRDIRLADGCDPWDDHANVVLCIVFAIVSVGCVGGAITQRMLP